MTEEGEAQRSIGADAVETAFGDIGNLIHRVGAEIGEFLRLQVAPHVLDWIEVRCVAWQPLDR